MEQHPNPAGWHGGRRNRHGGNERNHAASRQDIGDDCRNGRDAELPYERRRLEHQGQGSPRRGSFSDLDMGISCNGTSIPAALLRAMAGEQETMQLELAHDGAFGFPLTSGWKPERKTPAFGRTSTSIRKLWKACFTYPPPASAGTAGRSCRSGTLPATRSSSGKSI